MKNKIQSTESFQSLSKIQQQIYSKSANIREIEHFYIVAKNTGVNDCGNTVIKKIVQELLKDQ